MKILFLTLLFFVSNVFATTWDEPWQDKVIKEADAFILAKVLSYDEEKGVKIEVIKTLAGIEIKGNIEITNFYLLDLCSKSGGHGPEFHFKGAKEFYFFIKKNKKGEYCIATPTTGFDYVKNGFVTATYRHSYHQARVSSKIFEKTMIAIFNNYHGLPYDKIFINEYVKKYLSKKPAGFKEDEVETFFAQHVALETVFHLKLTEYYSEIVTFLKDTSNFHNQISAARALISYNTSDCKKELLKVISDSDSIYSDFVKVICIWTLIEFKPKELKEKLTKLAATASEEDNGFEGNIMDPRVCTHFPDVKSAINELIKIL